MKCHANGRVVSRRKRGVGNDERLESEKGNTRQDTLISHVSWLLVGSGRIEIGSVGAHVTVC